MHFPQVLRSNRVSLSNRFRDKNPQTYGGHDLDLSGSRDVIDHVIIRSAIRYFSLVVHWNQASVPNRFQDMRHQHVFTNTRTNEPTDQPTNQHDGSQYLLAEVMKRMNEQSNRPNANSTKYSVRRLGLFIVSIAQHGVTETVIRTKLILYLETLIIRA